MKFLQENRWFVARKHHEQTVRELQDTLRECRKVAFNAGLEKELSHRATLIKSLEDDWRGLRAAALDNYKSELKSRKEIQELQATCFAFESERRKLLTFLHNNGIDTNQHAHLTNALAAYLDACRKITTGVPKHEQNQ
jgi:hypothetical protein